MSLRIVQNEPWRREKLHSLVNQFRQGANQLGLALGPFSTPIQPLVLGDNRRVLAASRALRERGIYVTPIRPPTVPKGSARLRLTFTAAHDESDVVRLLNALEEILG